MKNISNNRRKINLLIFFPSFLFMLFLLSCKTIGPEDSQTDKNETVNPGDGSFYYVSVSGNDSNDGSIDNPWKTIKKAAETLIEGDTVYLRSGVYRERVVPKNSGTSKYITYTAYKNESVTIDGSNLSLPKDWGGLIDITNKSFIRISGLKVMNAKGGQNSCGILVDMSDHIIIENNYTYNTISSGIGVWESSNIILDGNEVVLACNDGEQECLTLAITDQFEIKNNHVHNSGPGSIGGEGLDAKDGSSNGIIYNNIVHDIVRLGIYADAWDKHTYNIEIFNNTVYNCRADGIVLAAENGGLLENIRIYNNLIYNNASSGITTADWGEKKAKHPLKDIFLINNTIYGNGSDWGGGIAVFNNETENLVIRNNILSNNVLFQIAAEVSDKSFMTVEYNLINAFIGYEYELTGNSSVYGNPLFINPAIFNFRLQSGSPAIDGGSSNGAPSSDFDGISRPQGTAYDIGAFEYKK